MNPVQKPGANALFLMVGMNRDCQKLCLVQYGAQQGETMRVADRADAG